MSDKSKNSPYERTVYVSPDDAIPGSSHQYGSWSDTPRRDHTVPLTIIEGALGSDYSGNLVEISNARVLKREFPWLVEIYGGYGTSGVAYLGKRENQSDALIEMIDALSDYPLADEDDHSTLEMETAEQAWEDDGRREWKRALVKYFDAQDEDHEHDTDLLTDSAVDALWWDCTEKLCGGEAHLNEQGDSIYFPIDRVIEKIERCWSGIHAPHYSGEREPISKQLETLAATCRTTEDK